MDGYVILNTLNEYQLVLDGWWCDPGALPLLEDYWTYTWIAIEELTTVFKINMSDVSNSNPVLPKFFYAGSTFYKPLATFDTTEKQYYLYFWEITHIDLPLDAVPGMDSYNIHIRWYYKDTPPDKDQDYLLPYNHEEFDAGDEQKYLYSDAGSSGYGMNLWRWQQWATLNRYICYSYATYFHELGGDPDWETDYWVESDETWRFHLQDEHVPPEQSEYLGGNVYNISQEFTDAIDIDSGYLGDMYYYYINLGGCTLTNAKIALQGKTPEVVPYPTSPLAMVTGIAQIINALNCMKFIFAGTPAYTHKKQLTINRRKGLAANGVPQGHATDLPDGVKS